MHNRNCKNPDPKSPRNTPTRLKIEPSQAIFVYYDYHKILQAETSERTYYYKAFYKKKFQKLSNIDDIPVSVLIERNTSR